jgi:hypothetical protein
MMARTRRRTSALQPLICTTIGEEAAVDSLFLRAAQPQPSEAIIKNFALDG